MATTLGVFNGTALMLYLAGNPIAHTTDFTLNIDNAIVDATSRNSAGWAQNIAGLRKWSISITGLVAYDDTTGFMTLMQNLVNRTEVAVKFSTGITGDYYFSGNVRVSKVSQAAKMESPSTFSCTLEGDGALAIGTN